jgi:hypothetical protein
VNKLIVEGKNDLGFINAYKEFLNGNKNNILFQLTHLKNGLSEESLIKELKTIKDDLENETERNIKIGFILDKDFKTDGYVERFVYLNNAIEKVFGINPLFSNTELTKAISYEDLTIEFSYCLMQNSKNEGELIDLLKEIKLNDSVIADCVTNCFQQKDDYTEKEISDDWLHIFLKWDSCNYYLRRNSDYFRMDNIKTSTRLEKIFDFKSESLNFLKEYLIKVGT